MQYGSAEGRDTRPEGRFLHNLQHPAAPPPVAPATRLSTLPGRVLILVSFISVGMIAISGTLMAAVFMAAGSAFILLKYRRAIPLILGSRAMLIPLWCLLSVAWSQYPALSLRYAVLLTFTMAVAIVLGARLRLAQIAGLSLVAALLPVVLGLLLGATPGGDQAWRGLFGSKNAMALYAVLALLSAAWLWSSRRDPLLRLTSLGAMALCILVLSRTQSVATTSAGIVALSAYLLFRSLGRFRPSSRLPVLMLGLLPVMLVVMGPMIFGLSWATFFLESTGKDPTLTGRTDLWAIALANIADHPLQGLGFRAFWVHGNAPAEALWERFLIESRTGFHFHNTYLSNAVDIGLIGVALQCLVLFPLILRVFRAALDRPTPALSWAAAFLLLVFVRSLAEVDVFNEFNLITFVLTAIWASWQRGQGAYSPPAPRRPKRRHSESRASDGQHLS